MGAGITTATTALGGDITTVLGNTITAFGQVLSAFGTIGIISALLALGVAAFLFNKVKHGAGF